MKIETLADEVKIFLIILKPHKQGVHECAFTHDASPSWRWRNRSYHCGLWLANSPPARARAITHADMLKVPIGIETLDMRKRKSIMANSLFSIRGNDLAGQPGADAFGGNRS